MSDGVQTPASPPVTRDRSVDVLKGIGIVIVAMGHIDYTAMGGAFVTYLYTFNVALFFIVAGYMWKPRPGVSVWRITARRFQQIYVPYVVLFTVSLLWGHIVVRRVFDQYVIPFELVPTLKALVFSSEWLNTVPTFNFALWFLPIFFLTSVAFEFFQFLRGRAILYIAAVVVVLALSLPFQWLVPGRPILNINVLPVGLVLMAAGYLIRKHLRIPPSPIPLVIVLWIVSLGVAIFIPGNISDIRSYLYYPSAIASFLLYLGLARRIEGSAFLGYVGRNSLLLFGLQGLVASTWPFTGIPALLEPYWDGLMLYAANLVYVLGVSVAVVAAYRALRGVIVARFPRPRRADRGASASLEG
ncbi:MAG: acyltransferase family protein [Microbacterium sp.]